MSNEPMTDVISRTVSVQCGPDEEIDVINLVLKSLEVLDTTTKRRVLRYVIERIGSDHDN
jgi:hypothetical protein